jgi:hypothetical protein
VARRSTAASAPCPRVPPPASVESARGLRGPGRDGPRAQIRNRKVATRPCGHPWSVRAAGRRDWPGRKRRHPAGPGGWATASRTALCWSTGRCAARGAPPMAHPSATRPVNTWKPNRRSIGSRPTYTSTLRRGVARPWASRVKGHFPPASASSCLHLGCPGQAFGERLLPVLGVGLRDAPTRLVARSPVRGALSGCDSRLVGGRLAIGGRGDSRLGGYTPTRRTPNAGR